MEYSSGYFRGLHCTSSQSDIYKIHISSGFFVPAKQQEPLWDSKYTYVNDLDDVVVNVFPNNDGTPKINYIVAQPDLSQVTNNFAKLKFKCKEDPPAATRNLNTEELSPEFPDNLNDDEILIAVVFNDSIKSDVTTIRLLSVNETNESFSFIIQPSDFRKKHVYSLTEWKSNHFYIKQQIVNHDYSLWYCNLSHVSTTVFTEDVKYFWTPIHGMSYNEIYFLIQNILKQININAKPGPPLNSIQWNADLDNFGGSADLLWLNTQREMILNGILNLKVQNTPVETPEPNNVRLFAEDTGEYILIKWKLENNREYIISSIKK